MTETYCPAMFFLFIYHFLEIFFNTSAQSHLCMLTESLLPEERCCALLPSVRTHTLMSYVNTLSDVRACALIRVLGPFLPEVSTPVFPP